MTSTKRSTNGFQIHRPRQISISFSRNSNPKLNINHSANNCRPTRTNRTSTQSTESITTFATIKNSSIGTLDWKHFSFSTSMPHRESTKTIPIGSSIFSISNIKTQIKRFATLPSDSLRSTFTMRIPIENDRESVRF